MTRTSTFAAQTAARITDRFDRAFDALTDQLQAIIDDPRTSDADRTAAMDELRALQGQRHDIVSTSGTGSGSAAIAADRWTDRLDDLVADAGDTYLGDDSVLGGDIRVGGRIEGFFSARPNVADGRALMEMYENDPEAFRAMWSDLGAEERQLAMFSLQQEAQVTAQMTTMITNLMQSQHSAAMAVARNLSV